MLGIGRIAQFKSVVFWEEVLILLRFCRQRNISIEQQSELHQRKEHHPENLQEKETELEQQVTQLKEELMRQAEDIRSNALSQGATIAELAYGMDYHASLINKLQEEQGQLESVPRISNSTVTSSITTEFPSNATRRWGRSFAIWIKT